MMDNGGTALEREVISLRRQLREAREQLAEYEAAEAGEIADADLALRLVWWAGVFKRAPRAERMPQGHHTTAARMLLVLLTRSPRPLSKQAIVDTLRARGKDPSEHYANVCACILRRALEAVGLDDVEVETIWGFGYRLSPAGAAIVRAYEAKHRDTGA
jgi:DNA-binding response OmpR family regulator